MSAEKTTSFRWFVEATSVVSAIAFVISGVANFLAFWIAWGVNYFSVATPGDIIVSTFGVVISLALVLAAGAGGLALTFGLITMTEWCAAPKPRPSLGSIASRQISIQRLRRVPEDAKDWLALLMFVCSLVITAALFHSLRLLGDGEGEMTTRFFSQDPGLIAVAHPNPACVQGRVVWLGSQAAIVRCGRTVEILHGLDGLRTRPVERR